MEEIAEVYARSLYEVAQEHDKLDEIHQDLDEFADAVSESRDLQVFLFSPYFSAEEKRDGLEKAVQDADETFMNFLNLLIERHRMPAIFRIRRRYDEMWKEAHHLLPVEVTSAIELDEDTVEGIGSKIGEQTGRTIELSHNVDPDIIGGLVLRVGNYILDASIRTRLNNLRKQVAQG